MSRPVDVLIFLEHVDRELLVVAAVANWLESRHGLTVEVRSLIFDATSALFTLRPRVVVTPSLSFGRGSVARVFWRAYGATIGYANMNWEQFISRAAGRLKLPKHPASQDQQLQFVWNDDFGALLTSGGVPARNIVRTGRPVEALLRRYYRPRRMEIRRELAEAIGYGEGQKTVLVAPTTKFISARHMQSFIESGANAELSRQTTAYVYSLAQKTVRWLPAVCADHPDAVFVLRPHPSVPVERWHELFQQEGLSIPTNVVISKHGNAYEWLAAADLLITDVSTLQVEARGLGCPMVVVRGDDTPGHLQLPWIGGAEAVADADAFRMRARDLLAAERPAPPGPEGVEDGIIQTADAIAALASRHHTPRAASVARCLGAMSEDPVRATGAIARTVSMQSFGGWPFVPPGLRPDFLSRAMAERSKRQVAAAYADALAGSRENA